MITTGENIHNQQPGDQIYGEYNKEKLRFDPIGYKLELLPLMSHMSLLRAWRVKGRQLQRQTMWIKFELRVGVHAFSFQVSMVFPRST